MLFEGPGPSLTKKELLFRSEMFNKNALATDSCRTRPTVTNKTPAGALEACINVAGGCNCTWGDELDRRLQSLMAKLDPCLWRNSRHLLPPPLPKKSNKQEPLEFKDVRSDCPALLADRMRETPKRTDRMRRTKKFWSKMHSVHQQRPLHMNDWLLILPMEAIKPSGNRRVSLLNPTRKWLNPLAVTPLFENGG